MLAPVLPMLVGSTHRRLQRGAVRLLRHGCHHLTTRAYQLSGTLAIALNIQEISTQFLDVQERVFNQIHVLNAIA